MYSSGGLNTYFGFPDFSCVPCIQHRLGSVQGIYNLTPPRIARNRFTGCEDCVALYSFAEPE